MIVVLRAVICGVGAGVLFYILIRREAGTRGIAIVQSVAFAVLFSTLFALFD